MSVTITVLPEASDNLEQALKNLRTLQADSIPSPFQQAVDISRHLMADIYCTVLYLLTDDRENLYITENVYCDPPNLREQLKDMQSGQGIGGYIMREGVLIVENITLHPRLQGSSNGRPLSNKFVRDNKIKAFVGLRVGTQAHPLGILFLNWTSEQVFETEQLITLRKWSDYLAELVTNIRSGMETKFFQREAQRFENLIFSLSSRQSHIDLSTEIRRILSSRNHNFSDIRIYLRKPYEQWAEFVLESENLQETLVTKPTHIVEFKDLVHHFASSQHDKTIYKRRLFGVASAHLVAPIHVGGNCVGFVLSRAPDISIPREIFTVELERTARELGILIRDVDTTHALVSLREISTSLAENYDLDEIGTTLSREISKSLRLLDSITVYYQAEADEPFRYSQAGVRNEIPMSSFPPHNDNAIIDLLGHSDPIFGDTRLVDNTFCREEGFRTSAAFPLRMMSGEDQGRNFGIMFFNYRIRNHIFDDAERNLLGLYSESATTAFNRAIQHQRAQREKRHLQTVKELAFAIKIHDPNEVIDMILTKVKEAFAGAAHNFALVEYDREREMLIISPMILEKFYRITLKGTAQKGEPFIQNVSRKVGLVGRLLKSSEEFLLATDLQKAPPKDYIKAIESTDSQLCVRVSENAALVIESDLPNAFNKRDHIALLQLIADYAAIAMQRAKELRAYQLSQEQLWLEEVGNLSTGLIHETKTIKANIQTAVSEMIKMTKDFQFEQRYAKQIERLDRVDVKISELNESLKDFINSHKLRLEETKLTEIIDACIGDVDEHLQQVQIVKESQRMESIVNVDRVWIRLVINNLLMNACRAIVKCGHEGQIRIRAKTRNNRVYLYVSDNGIGIHHTKREEIFKLGYSEGEVEDKQKHGIGLSFSRSIAARHGGRLYVHKSAPRKGSTFCLELPLVENASLNGKRQKKVSQ